LLLLTAVQLALTELQAYVRYVGLTAVLPTYSQYELGRPWKGFRQQEVEVPEGADDGCRLRGGGDFSYM